MHAGATKTCKIIDTACVSELPDLQSLTKLFMSCKCSGTKDGRDDQVGFSRWLRACFFVLHGMLDKVHHAGPARWTVCCNIYIYIDR